jgi:hypothetical protein
MPKTSTTTLSLLATILILAVPIEARSDTGVRIESDRFSKRITFEGSTFGKHSLLGTNYFHHVRSWVDRDTGIARHQLYVNILYADARRGYDRAANDDAQDMSVTRIGFEKDRGCKGMCSYSETIGIDLPESLMEAKAANGLQIKLYAHSGDSLILDIPAAEITAQLQAIDGYRHGNTTSPGTPVAASSPAIPFGVDFGNASPMWGLPGGALVASVRSNSIAARSGLHRADTITEWNGQKISTAADIHAQLLLVKPGEKIAFKALRGRKVHALTAEF